MPPSKPKIQEIEVDDSDTGEVGAASKAFRNQKGRTAMVVAVIGAACAGIASIVVPIAQSYFNRPPPAKSNSEEVMKVLKEESERQDKELKQMHDDMVELRSWLKGYLAAQGVKVRDPPDTPVPATTPVEITRPLGRRAGGASVPPAPVVVGTPLPTPRPLGRAKEIPDPFVPRPTE